MSNNSGSNFSLRVLHVINEARMCHGLRHKDYQLYRQYCSRRIRRLRKRFDLKQGERKFRKKQIIPETIKDEKLLELPLLQAERCWAYSMQLKEEAIQDNRKKFSLRNKLRKAAAYSIAFEHIMEVCGRCDARTQLEVQGYSAWLQGTVLFELGDWTQQWDTPLVFFNKALAIYSKLRAAVSEEEAKVIANLVAEMEVQLRYCRHQLGDASATSSLLAMTDDSGLGHKLDTLVSQTKEKQASTLTEVTWKKRTMSVKHEKVRLFFLTEGESHTKFAKGGLVLEQQLEKLLLKAKDAIAFVREDLNNDSTFKSRQLASTGPVSSTHFLFTYLNFLRLRLSAKRNLVMVDNYNNMISGAMQAPKGSKVPREQDVVRLYDLVIQNLCEMTQLAGLEEDLELKQENEAKILYYKALRCFHVAACYAKQEKWAEAQVLYKRTLQRIEQAKAGDGLSKDLVAEQQKTLQYFTKKIDNLQCNAKAQQVISNSTKSLQMSPTHTSKKMLADRLEEYIEDPSLLNPSNPRVLSLPPSMSPVPCKPLFFDLALSHVTFPDLDHKLSVTEKAAEARQQEKQQQTQQQGGLSGLVKNLWGGWGSGK